MTTNGLLLNEENIKYINENMHNIVLSIDGRKEVNDKMRCRVDGTGCYDDIMPKFKHVAQLRNQDNYYVRGTLQEKIWIFRRMLFIWRMRGSGRYPWNRW